MKELHDDELKNSVDEAKEKEEHAIEAESRSYSLNISKHTISYIGKALGLIVICLFIAIFSYKAGNQKGYANGYNIGYEKGSVEKTRTMNTEQFALGFILSYQSTLGWYEDIQPGHYIITVDKIENSGVVNEITQTKYWHGIFKEKIPHKVSNILKLQDNKWYTAENGTFWTRNK